MYLHSRLFSSSFFAIKPDCLLSKHLLFSTSSNAVEKFTAHLLKNGPNIEKSLPLVKSKLDTSSIIQVLERCSIEKPLMGLRFFIWAAAQPSYRLSSYTYSQACDLLHIDQNPQIINDVIEAYGVENCYVNVNMFKVVLNLCRVAKDSNMGLRVLKRMKEFHCRPDTTTYNVVIKLFCEKGEVEKGMELMREMGLIDLYPDMITYVSMVKGLCDVGKVEDACELINVMKRHGCVPNVVVYTSILDGIFRFRKSETAMEFLDSMEKEKEGGIIVNTVTYTAVIQSFCDNGRSLEGLGIFHRMKDSGHKPNKVTMSTLIEGLCKEGHLEEAKKVIESVLLLYDDNCYSSLVISLFRIGKCEEGESVYKMMLNRGFRIDSVALSIIMKWLCSKRRFVDAFDLYDGIDNSGNMSTIDSDIYSCLLDGLCHENKRVEVTKLLNLMVKRGIKLNESQLDNVTRYLKISGQNK